MKKLLSVLFCLTLVLGITLGLASCGKVEFKVDFVVDGEVYATVNTNGKETIKIPSDPTKEGYIFDGWYWDDGSWQKPFTANSLLDAPLSENMSVYAKWTTAESLHGVQAEFEGFTKISDTEFSMTVSNSTETISLGTKVTINSKSSWSLTSDIYGNTTIASKVAPLEIGDNVYYVLVTAENGQSEMYKLNIRRRPMYTVTFNTDGGTALEAVTIEEGETVSAPNTYKKGYTLSGWSYDFATPITQNETITALWLANEYVITYDANGGSVAHEETGVVYDVNYTLEVPTRTGYNFDGWYLGENLIENSVWQGDSDITVIAKWSLITYDIEYDLDGGTLATANPTTYNVESEKITLVAPTKTGYTFLGWTGTDVATPSLTVEIVTGSIGNRSYIANWSANTYTVTLDSNGGDETYENITATFDGNVTLPTPTKNGYTFVGWFEGETPYASGVWRTDKNVDLVAKWSTDSYSIGYTLNGGSVNGTNPTTYNVESEFTLINPTKTGYTFLGWTYGSVTEPALNVTISASTGDLAFVAHWKAESFKIYLDAKGGTVDKTEIPIDYDAEIILPTPEYVGHTFTGWSDGTNFVTGGKYNLTTNMNLVAVWDLDLYEIGYNLNGGTVDGKNPTTYTIESEFTLINPTKIGYTFLGWTYEGVAEPTLNVTISGRTENINFVAHFDANTYTVTYKLNGGTLANLSEDVVYGSYFKPATPTKRGYTFGGWYYDTGKDYDEEYCNDYYGIADNVTLVARWNVISYDVVYNLGGGINGNNPTKYTVEDNFALAEPTKTGYTFLGWTYGDVTEPTPVVSISSSIDKLEFIAHWEANTYNLTFDTDGGDVDVTYLPVVYDEEFTLPTPTRSGYTFAGWYYNGERVYSGIWNIDSDAEFIAQWDIITYSISYIMNGGTNDTTNPKNYTTASGAQIKNPTRVGYTFTGWTYGDVNIPVKNLTIAIGTIGAQKLTANWEANDYTLTFDANGGTITPADKIVTYNSSYTVTTPTRTGYTFGGWFVDGKQYSGGTWKDANDVTVIAKWTPNTYTLTYNLAGGTMSTISQSVTFDAAYLLKTPSRVGYTFAGWYDGDKEIKDGKWTLADDMTITAKWTANTYTITYVGNQGTPSKSTDTATYDSSITLATAERIGYTFAGWYCDGKFYESGTWKLADDVTLTAEWTANTNTKYTVNHHLQNIEDDRYTCDLSEKLEGTSDATVTPAVKNYTGFTSPKKQTVTIAPDGSLVVDYYYTRNYYTLTLVTNGGSGTAITQKYGSTLDKENWTTREGYTFGGWFTNATLLAPYTNLTMPAENRTIYAWWTEENKPIDFTYGMKNGTISVTSYIGTSIRMSIPAYIDNIPVTSIADNAFDGKSFIEFVVMPNTITTIGKYAFRDLSLITKIVVPNSVMTINEGAFKGCNSLVEMALPFIGKTASGARGEGVLGYIFEHTGSSAGTIAQFYGSSYGDYYWYYIPQTLRTITVTNTTRLSYGAFYNCDFIETITLPDTLADIGDKAFYNCSALKSLNSTTDGECNIPAGVTEIGEYTFYGCSNLLGITIPDSVTSIGNYAFSSCTSVLCFNGEIGEANIPSNVVTIGDCAFQDCSHITKVFVPNSVTTIGYGAFKGCNSLVEMTLPFIGKTASGTGEAGVLGYLFDYVGSSEGTVCQHYSDWKWDYHWYCIPKTLRTIIVTNTNRISYGAFYNCDFIETITLPDTVESIESGAFYNCNATIQYFATEN